MESRYFHIVIISDHETTREAVEVITDQFVVSDYDSFTVTEVLRTSESTVWDISFAIDSEKETPQIASDIVEHFIDSDTVYLEIAQLIEENGRVTFYDEDGIQQTLLM